MDSGAPPTPLSMPAAPPSEPNMGPIMQVPTLREAAGGIGAVGLGLGLAATGPVGWTAGAAAATFGGALGEAMGQIFDLSNNLKVEKDKIAGVSSNFSEVPAPSSLKESLYGIGKEGLAQGAFEGVTGGVARIAGGAIKNVPRAVVATAEATSAGKEFARLTKAQQLEARVAGANADYVRVTESADKWLNDLGALSDKEFSAQRAKDAMYLLKQSSIENVEKHAMFAQAAAKGTDVDMGNMVKNFTSRVEEILPKRGAPVVRSNLAPKFVEYLEAAKKAVSTKKPVEGFVQDTKGMIPKAGDYVGGEDEIRRSVIEHLQDMSSWDKPVVGDASEKWGIPGMSEKGFNQWARDKATKGSGMSEPELADAAKRILAGEKPLADFGMAKLMIKDLDPAEVLKLREKAPGELVKFGPKILKLGTKEVKPAAEKVPLDSLIYGISNLKKAIDEGVKGGMQASETGVLREYLREWTDTATDAFSKMKDPGKAQAWQQFLKTYGDQAKVQEMAMMKLADADPRKLADLITDNPKTVKVIKEMSDKPVKAPWHKTTLLDDVKTGFLEGVARDSSGRVKLEMVRSKLARYGESPGELFAGDRATLDRFIDMGKQAEDASVRAAETVGALPPATLTQKAWEAFVDKAPLLGGALTGGLTGLSRGGPQGAMAGAAVGSIAMEVASKTIPPAVLKRVAENPAAYEKWVRNFAKAGATTQDTIQGLADAIRLSYPKAAMAIPRGLVDAGGQATGLKPKPSPLPGPYQRR